MKLVFKYYTAERGWLGFSTWEPIDELNPFTKHKENWLSLVAHSVVLRRKK